MAKFYVKDNLVNGTTTIVKITQAQYNALSDEAKQKGDYLITDIDNEPLDSSVIEYEDDVSVKSALDTINNSLTSLVKVISGTTPSATGSEVAISSETLTDTNYFISGYVINGESRLNPSIALRFSGGKVLAYLYSDGGGFANKSISVYLTHK